MVIQQVFAKLDRARTSWCPALVGVVLALAVLALPVVGTGVGSGALPAVAQSDGRTVRATRYDVELTVQQGGDVLVRETQEIAFRGGAFQRGFRRIPLTRLEGIRDLRVEEVAPAAQAYRSGREAPYTFAISGQTNGGGPGSGDLLVEWWFPPTGAGQGGASRTFAISYRAVGVVRFYEGGDQVRWQVLGADRPYAVERSTITLRLPSDVSAPNGSWMTDLYPGRYLRDTAVSGNAVTWQAADISANEDIEARAQWPAGLISGSPPAWQAAADAADRRNETLRPVLTLGAGAAGLLIPLIGGLALLMVWYTRGRDPRIGQVPPELDSPPSDLPPALVGTVVDEHADAQDVVATVLDLAARGVLSIREVPLAGTASQLGAPVGGGRDFELRLLQERASLDLDLRLFERRVLDSFFTRGATVRLSELGGWFRSAVPGLQQLLHREVVDARLFAGDPDRVRQRYRRLGTLVVVAGLVLGFAACSAVPDFAFVAWWPGLGVIALGVLLIVAAGRMPQRTAAGALEAARWRAYARYLSRAAPQVLALPGAGAAPLPRRANGRLAGADGSDGVQTSPHDRGEVFERALPYAVALGIERTWVEKFSRAGTPIPRWFEPPVVVLGGPTIGGGPFGGPFGPYRGGYGRRWPGSGYPGGPGAPGGWGGGVFPGVPPGRQGQDAGAGGSVSSGEGDGAGGGLQGWSDRGAGGLEQASGSLVDLLNAASEVLSRGGGSGWSGGGRGGGHFGGGGSFGGGGGSGGGGSGFS